jgi:putative intracellular protease/amidase
LNTYSDFEIKTFSFDGLPVRSLGNVPVQPDLALREVEVTANDLLLLPGGPPWEESKNDAIIPFVEEVHHKKCTIAAICAATTILAKLGILDEIEHTSNGAGYIEKYVPDYSGQAHFVNTPAVCDERVITANGAGMIEFAYEIFNFIRMMSEDDLGDWFNLYKSGGMIYHAKSERNKGILCSNVRTDYNI